MLVLHTDTRTHTLHFLHYTDNFFQKKGWHYEVLNCKTGKKINLHEDNFIKVEKDIKLVDLGITQDKYLKIKKLKYIHSLDYDLLSKNLKKDEIIVKISEV